MLSFFAEKNFSTLAALTTVSNTTSTTIHCAAWRQRLEFCNFLVMIILKIFLAPIKFAKKIRLFSWFGFQILAVENALQSKTEFLRDAFGKRYLLRHLTKTIARKSLILEIGYTITQIQCFWQEVHVINFFPKVYSLKNFIEHFFGQVEISSGKQTYDTTCPTGKLIKKLISTPAMELKWLLFWKKLKKFPSGLRLRPLIPVCDIFELH